MLCSGKTHQLWCTPCKNDMLSDTLRCAICAKIVTHNNICGACLKNKPNFQQTEVLLQYQYPVNNLIKALKFYDRPEISKTFADLMTKKLAKKKELPQLLIPVPLHKKRQRLRGYNQSLLLAKEIAKQLKLKVNTSIFKRIKDTPPQSTLSINHRKKNVTGAFILTQSYLPEYVAIVDDVITSGSTVNELSKLLRKVGCKKIAIWAIART